MKAIVLEKAHELSMRDMALPQKVGPYDLKIKVHTVGICGSDVHYYLHGRIGPYVVKDPMVLGHEASGTVVEMGSSVRGFAIGDRVCMEPGVPDSKSRASRLGIYNLDPSVRFWATPPVDGCLTPLVVHPSAFCFHLPENMTFGEGALIEPLAVGMQAASKASICPGDVALVIGAGTIGMMTAVAAVAGGCSRVIISDVAQAKLDIIGKYPAITPVNINTTNLREVVAELTDSWGANIVFEASGSVVAYRELMEYLSPRGTLVLIGMPVFPIEFDVVAAQAKEITVQTVFRYANMFHRAISLVESGRVSIAPFISKTFGWEEYAEAFRLAADGESSAIKIQLVVDEPETGPE